MTVDEKTSGVEGYKQLSELMLEKIALKHYPVGSLLPSERELAELFQVNRRTVRRSLGLLEEQKILVAESTRGRRVVQIPGTPVANLALCFDDSLDQRDRLVHATGSSAEIARGFHQRVQQDGSSNVTWLDADNTRRVMNGEPPQMSDAIGVALWPTLPCPDATLAKLQVLSRKLRIVLLDRRLPGFLSDFVGFDDRQVGALVADHFKGFGYESYGFIGWAVPETVLNRLDGFATHLQASGLSVDEDWTILTRTDAPPTSQYRRFLQPGRPRAVFCANDILAVSLLLFLKENGLRVPEDIAVIGVGDSMGGLTETFGLTTVALPHMQIGWDAADLLLSQIREGRANGPLPTERRRAARLVVRRTCGASNQAPLY